MISDNNGPTCKGKPRAGPLLSNNLVDRIRAQQHAFNNVAEAMRPLTQMQSQFRIQVRAATSVMKTHQSAMQNIANMVESMNVSPLAKLDLMTKSFTKPILDIDRFNAAVGLSAKRRIGVAALNSSLFAPSFAREMQRLQSTLVSLTRNSAFTQLAKQFEHLRFPPIPDLSNALRASTLALRPFGEVFARMAEEEKTANFILELGFVPHDGLWDHITDMQDDEDGSRENRASQIAVACWPHLYETLALDASDCLNDQKLEALYRQMLVSHDAGHYEIVLTGLPTALERSVRLAVAPSPPRKIYEWIRDDIADLPIDVVGGIRGFRIWKILVEHTFKRFKSDQDADAIRFPNRHVVAHGAGSQPADIVQSLNAILLTHFVIRLAGAVIDYYEDKAA